MEPITLCGLVIVLFGAWIELEPVMKAVVKMICKSRFLSVYVAHQKSQKQVYVRRMPICVAKGV